MLLAYRAIPGDPEWRALQEAVRDVERVLKSDEGRTYGDKRF